MPRHPEVLDVVDLHGEKSLVVYVNDCACKIIPLLRRDWTDPTVIFKATEPGYRISTKTPLDEPGGGAKLLGRLKPAQLVFPEKEAVSAVKAEPQYDYIPRPGSVPKSKKGAQKMVITDDSIVRDIPEEVCPNDAYEALRQAGEELVQLFSAKTLSPAAQPCCQCVR